MCYLERDGQLYIARDVYVWKKKPHLSNLFFQETFVEPHIEAVAEH